MGNFPPRNPLKSLKTGKDLGGACGSVATVYEFDAREGRAKKLQKKAPNALKSLDAECHARESGHPDLAARAGALDSRFRGNDTADLIFE